jgi:hypothetical protein
MPVANYFYSEYIVTIGLRILFFLFSLAFLLPLILLKKLFFEHQINYSNFKNEVIIF